MFNGTSFVTVKNTFHSFIYKVLCAMSLLVTVTIFPVFNGCQTLDRLDGCLVFNVTISSISAISWREHI
jgi:hypothetical protein